jgi:hypothetical protein
MSDAISIEQNQGKPRLGIGSHLPTDPQEFELASPHSNVVAPWLRFDDFPPLQLETRGVTEYQQPTKPPLKTYLKKELWHKKRKDLQFDLIAAKVIFRESVLAKLVEVGAYDLVAEIEKCGTVQAWSKCDGCGKTTTFWNRCEKFWCPGCQPRLSRDRFESLEWWTKDLAQPKHLVLTARNFPELTAKKVKWFKAQFKKLRARKCCRNWHGGLWSLEVTNENRGWHLHLHILLDCRFVDIENVSRNWAQLMGQEFAICKVKDCRNKAYLAEVTKYAVKGSELAKWKGEDIVKFIWAFSRQKNFGVFGTLHGKRTQWREWIESLREHGHTCECGSCDFSILDHDPGPLDIHVRDILNGVAAARAP